MLNFWQPKIFLAPLIRPNPSLIDGQARLHLGRSLLRQEEWSETETRETTEDQEQRSVVSQITLFGGE